MIKQSDERQQSGPPSVGSWLALWAFVLIVLGALAYGASR